MADKKRKTNPARGIVAKVFALVFALVAGLGVLVVVQTSDIERGILEVCATQQDGYVQLVIDQINLKENREDEEIISDILETMDASSSKYWVFSRDQTMLFVKDVTETNRYKGFSATAYWGTADAQSFLDTLEVGDVKHDLIVLDDVEYLASGSVFTYDGRDYRLCLLTNRAALLDNNDYLGARSRLTVVMLVALGLLLIIPMALAFTVARERRRTAAEHDSVVDLSTKLHEISERMVHEELYNTRTRVWSIDAFDQFVAKLLERGAENAHFVQVVCATPEAMQSFLDKAAILLDEKVVRFTMSDEIAALLFVSKGPEQIRRELAPLLTEGVTLGAILPVDPVSASEPASAGGSEPGFAEEGESAHVPASHEELPPESGPASASRDA